jgi:hypothetical protein
VIVRYFSRRGLSLVEALIAAVIIGVSAISILELIRSGTASLEVTEAEAAARQLGADVLRRVCGPRLGPDTGTTEKLTKLLATPARWSHVLEGDPALAHGFPTEKLKSLLDSADVRLALEIQPAKQPALNGAPHVKTVVVTVFYTDRNARSKKVNFARLVEE